MIQGSSVCVNGGENMLEVSSVPPQVSAVTLGANEIIEIRPNGETLDSCKRRLTDLLNQARGDHFRGAINSPVLFSTNRRPLVYIDP
jgi:hypothetical protein